MAVNRQATLGAFVVGGIALAVGALVLFGNLHIFSAERRDAIVFEDGINGLSVGAPVEFRGVRVGSVTSISLKFDRETHRAYVPVVVTIDPTRVTVVGGNKSAKPILLPGLVKLGLRAQLNVQSFVTGQSEIDLDFDRSAPAVLHPHITDLPEIPTRPSPIAVIKEQLSALPVRELASSALTTIKTVQSIAKQVDAGLPALLESAHASSAHAQQTLETANIAIADLKTHVDQTLASIERLSLTADQQLSSRGEDLHVLLTRASDTVAHTRASVQNIESMTDPRAPARLNLDATLRDLAAAAASLRGLTADVERNPRLLLTGRHQ